jgi:hypothetical protein
MPEQPRPINVTKIVASAVGSVLAAVVLSKFGVAGTLTGAILGSVVSTIGAQVNEHYIDRSSDRLRRRIAGQPGQGGTREIADAEPAAPAAPAEPAPGRQLPAWLGWTRWLSWKRVALLGAGGFLAAMLVITGLELAAGRPLADLVGGGHSGRSTTIGQVTGGGTRATTPSSTIGTATTTGDSETSTTGAESTTTVPVTTVPPAQGPGTQTTVAPTQTTAG